MLIIAIYLCRKSRPEKESVVSDVSSQQQQQQGGGQPGSAGGDEDSPPGLLEVDAGLWDHITHIQTNIQPLPEPQQQAKEIAK